MGGNWRRDGVSAGVLSVLFGVVFSSSAAAELLTTKYQVSNTATGNADEAVIDSTGEHVAYVHSVGAGSNPELWIANIGFQGPTSVVAITDTPSGVQAHPVLNSFGDSLFFQSTNHLDLTGPGNQDGSPEAFQALTLNPGTSFRQLTNNQPGVTPLPTTVNPLSHNSNASVNSDGTMVVFSSPGIGLPAASVNNPEGNLEIFLYNVFDATYVQLTSTGAGVSNLHPVINNFADPFFGLTVAYISNDPNSGQNADQNYEVFMLAGAEGDPCLLDPGAPGCDPCIDDPTGPDCDPCLTDPNGPGCDPCLSENPPAECFGTPPTMSINPSGNQTVDEGVAIQPVTVAVTDAEGDPFGFRVDTGAATGVRVAITRDFECDPFFEECDCDPTVQECTYYGGVTAVVSWTPSLQASSGGATTPYALAFTATDQIFSESPPVTGAVTINVNDVNRPPSLSLSPKTQTIKAGLPITVIRASSSDLDKDPLTLTVSGLPSGAAYRETDEGSDGTVRGEVTWTPDASAIREAPYVITASVSDGQSGTVTATSEVTVVENREPVISNGTVTALEGACVVMTVRANDLDRDPLILDIVESTLPAGAIFLRASNTLHWHPGLTLTGKGGTYEHVVTLTAYDGTATVSKDVTIKVFDNPDDNASYYRYVATPTGAVAPGATVTLAVTFRNVGFSTWSGGAFALQTDFVSNGLTAPAPVAIAQTVIPGQIVTFTVPVVMPDAPGRYSIRFMMSKDGESFGNKSPTIALVVQ